MSLLVSIIVGLGERASGPLLGLRDFLQKLDGVSGKFTLLTAAHDNAHELGIISDAIAMHDHAIIVGHSLGGSAAYDIASRACGNFNPLDDNSEIDRHIDVLLLLDPVRPESWGFDSPQERPADMFDPLPNVKVGVCYFGVKDLWPRGNCFNSPAVDDGFYNVPLAVGHSLIPNDTQVREFLGSQIIQLSGE